MLKKLFRSTFLKTEMEETISLTILIVRKRKKLELVTLLSWKFTSESFWCVSSKPQHILKEQQSTHQNNQKTVMINRF